MFRPKTFHFQWHITDKCNLRCKHCYIDPGSLQQDLSFLDLTKILNKYLKQIKKWKIPKERNRISFTGGEPFLRDDFFELLQKCYENREIVRCDILTNGTLLNKRVVKKLRKLKIRFVQVSLEGTKKTNDYIRGKGTFEKITKGIRLLREQKILTGISMTVTKKNIQDVPAMVALANNLDVNYLSLRQIIPTGRGEQMKEFLLSIKEVRGLFLYILEAQKNSKTNINAGCEDGILAQEGNYLPEGCSAGSAGFAILPNGDVYPCRRLPIFSGNLLKQSFEEIYYDSKVFQELRNINNANDVCHACPYFNECHGGAKCINYSYFGDSFAPSPHCWRLFDTLPKSNLKWKTSKRKEKLDLKWIFKK